VLADTPALRTSTLTVRVFVPSFETTRLSMSANVTEPVVPLVATTDSLWMRVEPS
jgi:hypothetical protein